MKGGLIKTLLIIGSILITASISHSDTLRCGSKLVSVGEHKLMVKDKCGEPESKDRIAYEVARDLNPDPNYQLYRYIDEWVYDSRKNPKIKKTNRLIRLIFEMNILKRIEILPTY